MTKTLTPLKSKNAHPPFFFSFFMGLKNGSERFLIFRGGKRFSLIQKFHLIAIQNRK
jgi:hypothetical protein